MNKTLAAFCLVAAQAACGTAPPAAPQALPQNANTPAPATNNAPAPAPQNSNSTAQEPSPGNANVLAPFAQGGFAPTYAKFQPTQDGQGLWIELSSDANLCEHTAAHTVAASSAQLNLYVAAHVPGTYALQTGVAAMPPGVMAAGNLASLDATCRDLYASGGPTIVSAGAAGATGDNAAVQSGTLNLTRVDASQAVVGGFDLLVGPALKAPIHGDFNAQLCPALSTNAALAVQHAPQLPRLLDSLDFNLPPNAICDKP